MNQGTAGGTPHYFGTHAGIHPQFADALATQPDDARYDPRVGYMLSVVSAWSYAEPDALKKQIPYYGLSGADIEQISIFNDPMLLRATAYLIRSASGETGIVSFRGTMPSDAVAWLADFNATWTDFGDHGRVHAGFYANVQILWGDIQEWLERSMRPTSGNGAEGAKKPLRALYVTGHSLGAAMAVLAAARMVEDRSRSAVLRGVYTYGQPMVGDGSFRAFGHDRLGWRLYRHVFDSDIVCRMPPRTVSRFEHFGRELFSASADDAWQESGSRVRATPAWLLTPALLSAAASFYARRVDVLHRLRLPYSMDDHSPTHYIDVSHRTAFPARAVDGPRRRPSFQGSERSGIRSFGGEPREGGVS